MQHVQQQGLLGVRMLVGLLFLVRLSMGVQECTIILLRVLLNDSDTVRHWGIYHFMDMPDHQSTLELLIRRVLHWMGSE